MEFTGLVRKNETKLQEQSNLLLAQLNAEISNRQNKDNEHTQAIETLQESVTTGNQASKDFATTLIQALKDGDIATIKTTLAKLDGDETVAGSLKSEVAKLTGGITVEELDSIKELATAIENDPNFATTIRAVVQANFENAKADLRDGVAGELDTFKEVAAKFDQRATEVENAISNAKTEALNSSKAYTDSKSPVPDNFVVQIADGKIILPKKIVGNSLFFAIAKVFENEAMTSDYGETAVLYDATANGTEFEGRRFLFPNITDGSQDGNWAIVSGMYIPTTA
jgi:hypothetical protein